MNWTFTHISKDSINIEAEFASIDFTRHVHTIPTTMRLFIVILFIAFLPYFGKAQAGHAGIISDDSATTLPIPFYSRRQYVIPTSSVKLRRVSFTGNPGISQLGDTPLPSGPQPLLQEMLRRRISELF